MLVAQLVVLPSFRHLTATVKCDIDINLAPCTAIVGPNRAQKTAVLDAFRLALTGKHPIGSDAADLYELAPPNRDAVLATLVSDVGNLSFALYAPSGKPKKPTHQADGAYRGLAMEHALPLTSISDLLSFGTAKAREALIKRFGVVAEVPTPLALSTTQAALWQEVLQEAVGTDATARLAAVGTVLRSRKARRSKEVGALERSVTAREQAAEGTTAGAELLGQYEAQLPQAEAWARTETLRARKAALLAKLAEPAPLAPGGDTPKQDVSAEVFLTLLERSHAAGICLCCKTGKVAAARVDEVRGKIAGLKERVVTYAAQHAAYAQWQQSQLQAKAELDGIETGLVGAPTDYKGPVAADLRSKIDRIRTAQTARKALLEDAAKLRALRTELDDGKVLEKEAAKLLSVMLTKIADTAAAAVNRYMPSDLRVTLEATDKECQWRVVGTDGRAHKRGGASGREWGSLLVALAQAWSEGAPLRVLLLDDTDLGSFDPANIAVLLDTIRESVERGDLTQALIVSSRPDEIPAGWLKIFRG